MICFSSHTVIAPSVLLLLFELLLLVVVPEESVAELLFALELIVVEFTFCLMHIKERRRRLKLDKETIGYSFKELLL